MLGNLLNKRYSLSPVQVFIVYGLIICLFMGYMNMVYTPRSRLIREKKAALDEITMSLSRSDIEMAELERLNRELKQIQEEVARFDTDIPSHLVQEYVLQQLSSLASMSNVTIQSVTFSAPRPYVPASANSSKSQSGSVQLMVLPVSLNLSGSWTELNTFFAVLFAFREGLVLIEGFQTTPSGDGMLSLQATLLYLYRGGDMV